jgi:hypothetical protein
MWSTTRIYDSNMSGKRAARDPWSPQIAPIPPFSAACSLVNEQYLHLGLHAA